MAWRLANSLVTLRNQLNAAYPNRSIASDGTKGDAAHAKTVSQHNPNKAGVVTAMDITHDPRNGVDGQTLADRLVLDNRTWYVIFNRRIRYYGGQWQSYNGANPHTKHVHISTVQNPGGYDDPRVWNILNSQMKGESMVNEEILWRLYWTYLNRPPNQGDIEAWLKPGDKKTNDLILTLEAAAERKQWVDNNNNKLAELEKLQKSKGFEEVGTLQGIKLFKEKV